MIIILSLLLTVSGSYGEVQEIIFSKPVTSTIFPGSSVSDIMKTDKDRALFTFALLLDAFYSSSLDFDLIKGFAVNDSYIGTDGSTIAVLGCTDGQMVMLYYKDGATFSTGQIHEKNYLSDDQILGTAKILVETLPYSYKNDSDLMAATFMAIVQLVTNSQSK